MVIDSSVLIAILLEEPDASCLIDVLVKDPNRLISAFTALETSVVLSAKKGAAGGREFDLLLHQAGIEIISFNADQMAIARLAYARFGKGKHPAGLNLGDCCSYALSLHAGEPLLFKGEDFSKTDVARVAY